MQDVVTEKKRKCTKCGRILNKKHFVFNNLLKELVCTRCDKKKGHNIYFVPKENRHGCIGRYDMSDNEKNVLHEELVHRGLDSYLAWKKINRDIKYMRWLKHKNMENYYSLIKKQKEQERNDMGLKIKLVEGLK